MNRFPLTCRLVFILSLPLAAVLAFGWLGMWEKHRATRDCAWLDRNYPVFRQLGLAVHQLQRKRGRATVFTVSRGARFTTELQQQQRATDAALDQLRQVLPAPDSTGFPSKLRAALDEVSRLTEKRTSLAGLTLDATECSAYFTQLIEPFTDLMTAISHGIGGRISNSELKSTAGVEV